MEFKPVTLLLTRLPTSELSLSSINPFMDVVPPVNMKVTIELVMDIFCVAFSVPIVTLTPFSAESYQNARRYTLFGLMVSEYAPVVPPVTVPLRSPPTTGTPAAVVS